MQLHFNLGAERMMFHLVAIGGCKTNDINTLHLKLMIVRKRAKHNAAHHLHYQDWQKR